MPVRLRCRTSPRAEHSGTGVGSRLSLSWHTRAKDILMVIGQCLCGDHRFRLDGDLVFMHHCHCGYCRKSHGSAYSTMIGVEQRGFHWEAEGERIVYPTSEGFSRESCARCGSPLPVGAAGMPVFAATGLLEGEFGHRAELHIFVESKAPWFEIRDGLPVFDAYPPGIDMVACETREPLDPPGGVRGSCLCGRVRFVLDGSAIAARHCHCVRCQRARGAAHASNLIVDAQTLRFTGGEGEIRLYKVPEARFFTQSFCGGCGSCVPRIDTERGVAVVPLGCLDDAPPIGPQEHIWVESKAVWHSIEDDLPQRAQGPPGSGVVPIKSD
jgi:hypothetical protein